MPASTARYRVALVSDAGCEVIIVRNAASPRRAESSAVRSAERACALQRQGVPPEACGNHGRLYGRRFYVVWTLPA